MRWFKHISTSADDERLAYLIDEAGLEGYGFWWRLLEIISSLMDKSDRCHAEYSEKKWAQLCHLSPRKFRSLLKFVASSTHESSTNSERTPLVNVTKVGNLLKIECPNLLKYKDEYTKKSGHTTDKVRSHAGQTPDQDTDTDTDKEVKESGVPAVHPKRQSVKSTPPEGAAGGEPKYGQDARAVLDFLNEKSGKSFKYTASNLKVIASRLQEGFTVEDCRAVVAGRVAKWGGDPKMREYIRPSTLFQASKFEGYLNDSVDVKKAEQPHHGMERNMVEVMREGMKNFTPMTPEELAVAKAKRKALIGDLGGDHDA